VGAGESDGLGTEGAGGTEQDILRGAVVLDEIEVGGGEILQGMAEAADDGKCLEKNFGKNDGGTEIEVNAAAVEPAHGRAEEAEVVVAGGAEGGAVGGGMHLKDVGADAEMDSEGDAAAISGGQERNIEVTSADARVEEKFSCRFAEPDATAMSGDGGFVEIEPGFAGEAEAAAGELGLDVFRGAAGEADFEIVDEGSAGGGDAGDVAAAHQINEDGGEAGLDDVAAQSPEDGLAAAPGAAEGFDQAAEFKPGQNGRERTEEVAEAGAAVERPGEILRPDFGGAARERFGGETGEFERVEIVI